MFSSPREYSERLAEVMGAAWNRWWFTPRDPVHLAALRIALGLMVLYWLGTFSTDLVLLFGEGGVLPADTVRELTPGDDPARYSFLHWLKSPAELWAVHVAALAAATLLIVGLFTRTACLLTLVAFLAYVHRAWMIMGILEPVLAFGLFYLCFAPCGRYFSVDAWLRRGRHPGLEPSSTPSLAANIVTRLLQMHVALVYFMMGITMLSSPFPSVWWIGDAVWYLIARPESRLVDLTWLHRHEYLLNFWTHSIVLYELTFAVFVWNRWTRPVILLLGIAHWGLLAVVTGMAPFCLTMLALNLAFLAPPCRGEVTVQRAWATRTNPAAAEGASRAS